MNPADKRLAVEVEDHPLSYFGWEGIIPEGRYGAGQVVVWDQGTFEPYEPDPGEALKKGRLSFRLEGKRLSGDFVLMRMSRRRKSTEWLLIKKKDLKADPGWSLESALTPERIVSLGKADPPCGIS